MVSRFIPKIRNLPVVINAERIFQSSTDFIRGNAIVSTASVGAGVTGLIIAAATIRRIRGKKRRKSRVGKRVKRKKSKRGKRVVRKLRKTKRITHRSPRHRGHKRVSFTTKEGKTVSFLVPKKSSKVHKMKRRKRR